ncbi:MAG TPA: FAD-dependent oxidoreductase [Methylomirabilota bacterium]|nr:FAD-dependent oxidoreductase [Methylomirabilota bacterium]
MAGNPIRILILGGGFGGVYTAMTLEKLLARDAKVEITLVNRNNYLVYQPMLPEVISGTIGVLDPIIPIRRLCPRVKLYTREVEEIDLRSRRVVISPGVDHKAAVLEYDHLVLALGNITRLAGMPGLQEHALPFKYLGDALVLRNHVLHALEEAAVEDDPAVRRRLLTFVVGGAGYSGVEVAAELNELVRKAARSYRNLRPDEIRVIILELGARILPELPQDLADFALKILTRRGVEIRLKVGLAGATVDSAVLDTGEHLPTRTLVSTVPAAPNPLVATLPCTNERGRIVVDEFLEVRGYPGVWAVGDNATILDPATGRPYPPTAQHALRQGKCVADNIAAAIGGGQKRRFAFVTLGAMCSLGGRNAVANIRGVKLSGFSAWLLARLAYLLKLPGTDRKVRVAMGWFVDLLLSPDIVQMKTDRPATISRQHFEPGQVVFRQGDIGDLVYAIAKGEVEVTRESPGGKPEILARLGPGQWFGEMALISHAPRNATVHSATPLDVLTLDREAFDALFTNVPALREFFEELIRERGQGPVQG